ncbi:MAG: MBL fold metallo-hydrolase [Pikeienuella sp.]
MRRDPGAYGPPELWPGEPPAPGGAVRLAERLLWLRLPLPNQRLSHVNLYALEDPEGWTLIDSGLDWPTGRKALEALLAGPLEGRPVRRLILTHHHPDHIGMAAHLVARGAEIWTSRTAWLFGRMLTLDVQERPPEAAILFRRRAGLSNAALAAFSEARPFNFADCVTPLPLGFRALEAGDLIEAGGLSWQVRVGQGHAPDHLTLWSQDGAYLIAGDQVLPGISSNIGVYPTEPEADPLAGWLESCSRFAALGADPLVLPGHQQPFRGLVPRLRALIRSHEEGLARMEAALEEGEKSTVDLFPALYRREIMPGESGLALVEAVAHCNHLIRTGRAVRRLSPRGVWLYARATGP